MINLLQQVRAASRSLALLSDKQKNALLLSLAEELLASQNTLLTANQKDLDKMDSADPKYDRLCLTPERIEAIAADIKNVVTLPSALGETIEQRTLENGLELKKIRVPLGVIGVIYEARPNVTFDVFSLCFKSGNASVLKGGSDAADSNKAAMQIIKSTLKKHNLDTNFTLLLPPDREAVKTLLEADKFVDVIIPRGGQNLINFVKKNSRVPIIETGAGICHTYVDKHADLQKARAIITNAKTRRVSVCNALDTLVIHKERLPDLPVLTEELAQKGTEIFADEPSCAALPAYPNLKKALPEHFGTEFLSNRMSIKTVSSLEEAIDHITRFSSMHSEAIVTEDQNSAQEFLTKVDAAVVYVNASTAFTDGAQFGMGAEIGISTQKLHARGPMALKELTSYKWIVRGDGQVRQ
ncbi:glutamate-5-semialdehyde dehydrogenase [Patescibacteria group bacterium]|nr:glutamate-5-semialdehyde dehydrogenase [Patescibacteria group bacterium]